jgi:hypothetical protein
MAAGDLKSPDCIVISVPNGNAVTKGQLLRLTGSASPTQTTYQGPFAVAIEDMAFSVTSMVRACIWGPVEITYAGTNDTPVGGPLMPALDPSGNASGAGPIGTVTHATATTTGLVCGLATEIMDTSGNNYTMFIGIGGT